MLRSAAMPSTDPVVTIALRASIAAWTRDVGAAVDDDVGAFFGDRARGRESDAGGRAGDERAFAVQAEIHSIVLRE